MLPKALVAAMLLLPALALMPGADAVLFDATGPGKYTAEPGSFYCPGKTFDILFHLSDASGADAIATIVATDLPDCSEVWPELHVRGNPAAGWTGFCSEVLPTPCAILNIGPLVHGGHTDIALRGPNVGLRTGYIQLP